MTHRTTAHPEKLAEAHRYLIAAFALAFAISLLQFGLNASDANPPDRLSSLLDIASVLASIPLCAALFIAARRLGFGLPTIILSLLLAFVVPLLGLVLVVSADLRLVKALRGAGWKVGLWGARR